jgi:hypothetical protein
LDYGLENLLNLDEFEFTYETGHWYKIEAKLVEPTKERPHGIRYNLTFHDKYNKRIFGIDNSHGVNLGKRFSGRLITYDHLHKNKVDKGTPYEFENAEKLLQDFFENINKILWGI